VKHFSNESILLGFKENENCFLEELYKNYYPSILKFINQNNGSNEDAKDVFQETLLIIYQKIRNDSFSLETSFLTYLYAISKNLWLKELRRRKIKNLVLNNLDEVEDIDYYVVFEDEYRLNVEYFIFRSHFNHLSRNCREILKMFLNRISYDKIAEVLNYKSDIVVRKRKFRCKNILVENIKKDIRYKEITQR
jgi:RNA polymerase sigma factor (sigma-70 family)